MKTLKRWVGNIRWLLNHPPTGMTNLQPNEVRCKYCGTTGNCIKWGDVVTICFDCMYNVFEKILNQNVPEVRPLSPSELYKIRKHLDRASAKNKDKK